MLRLNASISVAEISSLDAGCTHHRRRVKLIEETFLVSIITLASSSRPVRHHNVRAIVCVAASDKGTGGTLRQVVCRKQTGYSTVPYCRFRSLYPILLLPQHIREVNTREPETQVKRERQGKGKGGCETATCSGMFPMIRSFALQGSFRHARRSTLCSTSVFPPSLRLLFPGYAQKKLFCSFSIQVC